MSMKSLSISRQLVISVFSLSFRHTSAGADVVIVGGDLNMHPQDLGTRLLRSYTDCGILI